LPLAGVSEQVVITAQATAQPVDEVSKAVSVVDRREIEERDESAVTEALRTVPGLRIQQLGGPGRLVSIKARGLRNQDTAVLIDGIRFRDATTGDATSFLSDFLVTNLDRIEVLRGSGSSLYGTNAIGGVVNIVTDEGGSPTHGNILLEGGGLGLFRGRAQVAGGTSRFIYSAGATHLNVARGIDRDDAARNGPRHHVLSVRSHVDVMDRALHLHDLHGFERSRVDHFDGSRLHRDGGKDVLSIL